MKIYMKKILKNGLIEVEIQENGVSRKSTYICTTCKKHLNQGKLPPMSVANGLELVDLEGDKELNLTELENNLIAKRILFQKIYQLPKSRMAGCKDKLINIPINDADIINTEEYTKDSQRSRTVGNKLEKKVRIQKPSQERICQPIKNIQST